ncbi:MAG: murein biosynthesis integral membrane protein MurJ [Candidatus Saccharibacteria bacterium]|nr:murein biosynthesis integral membrane protein MurJ [Candidatus Saccharibacteria bacterium]
MRKLRFKSVVAMANQKLSIKSASIILASSTLLSALLGIFRDRLLNSYYLDTYPTGIDAYTAAFTIPDFMFFILTSGALAVSFIPVFNQRLMTGNKKSAWELSTSVLNIMAIVTFVASVLIMIFADPLVRYVVGPGLDEPGTILAINMMRVIAINPFLMSIATVLSSVQQAVGRFVFYALAPAMYNIGILVGIMVFTNGINIFGVQIFDGGIMGVAVGVVFGAILQVLVSLVGVFGLGFDYEFKIYWKNRGFRDVIKMLPARSMDQGLDYVNTIVNTNLSSRMGAGALRSFQQATNLHQMPINLIGVAISTAVFPQMTEDLGAGDEDKYNETFRKAIRMIIWISLPVSVIAFFGRGYVVSFIKNGGDPLIASVLGTMVLAVFARSVFHIASRGFYARQDTKTPFVVSVVTVGLTILLAVLFTMWGYGPEGLGYSQSIGAMVEIVILLVILQKRAEGKLFNREYWRGIGRMGVATVITGCVAYSMTKFFPLMQTDDSLFATMPKFVMITVVSTVAYMVAGYFLNLEEVEPFVGMAKKVGEKVKKVLFRNVR